MNLHSTLPATPAPDAELVALSAAGDREAFGHIVARYQSLVCAIAYNATGSVAQSEDLAQETFLAAWKQLRQLHEPAKLKSWLCGIARNLTLNARRRLGREPAHQGESLDVVAELAAPEPLPSDQAVTREQEAILWRALERIPATYREPLILFYREHQSIARVATGLDLTEDAVKQRLSRGRKLLHEQVLAFVEGALAQTTPGTMFTMGVVAALPLFAAPSTAVAAVASAGAVATKSGAATAGSTALAVGQSLLGPLIGILGAWIGVRAGIAAARTPRERAFAIRQAKVFLAVAAGFVVVVGAGAALLVFDAVRENVLWVAGVGLSLVLLYVAMILNLVWRFNRGFARLRAEEMRAHPEAFSDEAAGDGPRAPAVEYRSRHTFLGLPLLHVQFGRGPAGKKQAAIGWLAVGERAFGLVAFGGVACGGIAMGGVSIGVLSIGGVALGLIGLGGLAIGQFALGGAAIGVVATGGLAFGWVAAEGGVAMAREFALGGAAAARHVNDAAAEDYFRGLGGMDLREGCARWVLTLCWLPAVIALGLVHRLRARRRRPAASPGTWRRR